MRDKHGLVHYAMHPQSSISYCYLHNVAWAEDVDGIDTPDPLTCLRCVATVFNG